MTGSKSLFLAARCPTDRRLFEQYQPRRLRCYYCGGGSRTSWAPCFQTRSPVTPSGSWICRAAKTTSFLLSRCRQILLTVDLYLVGALLPHQVPRNAQRVLVDGDDLLRQQDGLDVCMAEMLTGQRLCRSGGSPCTTRECGLLRYSSPHNSRSRANLQDVLAARAASCSPALANAVRRMALMSSGFQHCGLPNRLCSSAATAS